MPDTDAELVIQTEEQRQEVDLLVDSAEEAAAFIAKEFRKRLPEIMTHAPDMPRLVHAWLSQQVEGRHELSMRSRDLTELTQTMKGLQRRVVAAILGVGLLIVAAVLYALEAGGPRLLDVPASAWIAGIGGLWALLAAWPRR